MNDEETRMLDAYQRWAEAPDSSLDERGPELDSVTDEQAMEIWRAAWEACEAAHRQADAQAMFPKVEQLPWHGLPR